jgi:predicted membrane protein
MTGSKSWWERPSAEWLSVGAAIATGPAFVLMTQELNFNGVLDACFGLFVWAVVVSVIIGVGGRFRSLDRAMARCPATSYK